jgi:hypothetical protein
MSKFTFQGTLVWERRYETGYDSRLTSVSACGDGFLAVGRTGPDDGYLVLRTDSEGLLDGAVDDGKGRLGIDPLPLETECGSLGWIAACAVLDSSGDAEAAAAGITETTGLESDFLWIPHWQSLSGVEGWLVCAYPYMSGDGSLDEGLEDLSVLYPDAYFIWVSQGRERATLSLDGYRELFSLYW